LWLIGLFIITAIFLSACNTSRPSFDNHGIYPIKVVMDNNYPPFTFLDANGQPQGILIDRWRLWEQKTGIKAQITTTDWEQALQRMANGEFDVIDTVILFIIPNGRRKMMRSFLTIPIGKDSRKRKPLT
jgi:ABC-type amino acid transport substrate-binding protein